MNKKIILFTIILILSLIIGVTSIKIYRSHKEKQLIVSTKYIIEKAQLCYNEKKCTEDTVTLKKLYDFKYLEKQKNPITKKYFNENSIIKKEGNNYTFEEVN